MTAQRLTIGIVMDPIETITPKKDSSLAMLLEADRRGAEIRSFSQSDLRLVIELRHQLLHGQLFDFRGTHESN